MRHYLFMGIKELIRRRLNERFASKAALRQLRVRIKQLEKTVATLERIVASQKQAGTAARTGLLAAPAGTVRELVTKGEEAYKQGDYKRALRFFGRAVELAPRRPWPHVWHARTENKLGRYKKGLAAAQRALDLDSDAAAAWFEVAESNIALQDSVAATKALAAVLAKPAITRPQLRRVIHLAEQLQAPDVLVDAAKRLAVVAPHDHHGVSSVAATLRRQGHEDDAEQLLEVLSGPMRVRVAAQLHLAANRPDLAWAAISEVRGADAKFLTSIASALRATGRLSEAIEALSRATKRAPDDDGIQRMLHNVQREHAVLQGTWKSQGPSKDTAPIQRHPGRVLHVVSKSVPHALNGYAVRTQYILRAQRAIGIDARAATSWGFPWNAGLEPQGIREVVDQVPYYRLGGPVPEPPSLDRLIELGTRATLSVIERFRPAVLHAASDFKNATVALEAGRIADLPVIYEVRGFWEETRLSSQGVGAELRESYQLHREREIGCMNQADLVITLAEVMKDEIVARGIHSDKVAIVPNAVDVEAFRPQVSNDRIRAELGIRPTDLVLGYVTSLTPYEGISTLLNAAASLRHEVDGLRVLLVGDGESRVALEALVDDLKLRDVVIFTGRVPHDTVLHHYGAIDIFVVPREDMPVCHLVTPLKPFEAMAMGLPVVVSDVLALRRMVEEADTGLTFRAGDADDLARVLLTLVNDASARQKLGERAREWVAAERTWEGNAEIYRKLYASLGAI